MKIRTKILLSLIATAVLIIIAFIIFLNIKVNRDRLLRLSNQKQQDLTVRSTLQLYKKHLVNLEQDYSIWDEMVLFAQSGDTLWSNSNIKNVPEIHNLDGVWVINKKMNHILNYNNSGINLDEYGFLKPVFINFLDKNRTCYFFIISRDKLYEVAAGTIHPSTDVLKEKSPEGYLIFCRKIDSTYLNEMETLSGCQISFIPASLSLPLKNNHDNSEISTIVQLFSWDHQLIGTLRFSQKHLLLQSYFKITSLTTYIYLFLSLLTLSLICTALYFWINKPMTKIVKSLALESSDPIQDTCKKKNEFGEIATMINRFFKQKKELAEIIHEKNEALTCLSGAEAKNRNILDAIPDLLIKINLFGIISDFHVGHQEYFPFSEKNLLGKTLEEILPPQASPLIREALRELNNSRRPQSVVIQIPTNKERTWFYEATLTSTNLGDYLMVLRNITSQKEAEMALNRLLEKEADLNNLKTQLITTVSHEFRTPLSAISSNIQLLELYALKWPEEKKKEVLSRIQKAIHELVTLLNDLSAIAKDQSGKLKINATHFDLPDFCNELIKDTTALFESKADIRMDYSSEIIQVIMDKDLLRHIFINLLSNAVKFSREGQTIQFQISAAENNQLKFIISDKGLGIPPDEIESICEPFYRGNNVVAYPGTGLGLSIVKRCIELHHGTLHIESELHQGTQVTVILPAFFCQNEKYEKNSDHRG